MSGSIESINCDRKLSNEIGTSDTEINEPESIQSAKILLELAKQASSPRNRKLQKLNLFSDSSEVDQFRFYSKIR